MKYEATIHFELKDEKVDLTELITDQKIDIHGVGLVGRTDEGEVASEMQMMWGGVVGWSDDKKVKMAQATEDVSRRLGVDEETAEQLCEWMSFVYGLMASHGLCAYPGDQPVRVIPEALEFMRSRAAAVPEEGE
jgi:hypothetical protein